MTPEELKSVADGVVADFKKYRETNDEILKRKAEGKAVADLEEKLSKIEKSIQEGEELKAAVARMETAMKRTPLILGANGQPVRDEDVAHRKGVLGYLRKGHEANLAELQSKALTVQDDTSGGFMVHADLSGQIVKRIFETSPIRQFANVQTIGTDALEGPIDNDEADSGWVAETGARPNTNNPKIGMWRIPTHEQYAMPAISQKMLDDGVWDVETWLAGKVSDKFARRENAAFVSGDGNGKPRGILSYDTVAEAASNNYNSLKKLGYIKTGKNGGFADVPSSGSAPAQADALLDLVYGLKSYYRALPGTAFGMHRTTLAACRKLRDNLGQYLWQPGLGVQPGTMFGYPVAEFNDMPEIATGSFSIAFGNFNLGYQIVDRVGIRVLRDPFTSKGNVQFYTTKRVGGDVLNFEAIKLLKFSA